jgi:Ca2+/Na+ antiporter
MTIVLLLVGLGLIVLGADWLVEGASSIARKAGVSEFVIGLTIVGFGTSCPELVVSLTGAFAGNADIAVGNVIGSNIFNVLFILGLTALFRPVSMTRENRKNDIPLTLIVTVLFLAFGLNHTLLGTGAENGLQPWEGVVFLLFFSGYLHHSFHEGKATAPGESAGPRRPVWLSAVLVAAGLAGLIFGGNLFVDKATVLARDLGVSDKFIAVTVLPGGLRFQSWPPVWLQPSKAETNLPWGTSWARMCSTCC